jgi:uncharacterized damage-inducible protein DinB
MRVQDYIADAALQAAEEAFRYAKGVPPDKLDWAPFDVGRSILSICRELAVTPTWTLDVFSGSRSDAEAQEGQKAEMESWKTVEACEAEFKRRFAEVDKLFRGFSDSDLELTKWLPYNGGRDHTYLEMMDYPRWNCTYHTGQIAYIQTLYGDKVVY